MALSHRGTPTELVHHPDCGSQYASTRYQRTLRTHGIRASMSRRRDCWDNAVIESFFATLKTELVHHEDFDCQAKARAKIFDFIEVFYNQRRRYSTLGYIDPAAFESMALAA